MRQKFLQIVTGATTGVALTLASGLAQADVPESEATIKLGVNEWTTQQVITQVAEQLLEEMGYSVESVTVGYYPQIEAMIQNDLTATLELWPNNVGEGVFEAIDAGELVHLGDHELSGGGQLYYGGWMDEQCPGLPDYVALQDCIHLLESPETAPSGRFVGYPADWGNVEYEKRFAALGLDLQVVKAGGEGSLIAEIASAHERQAGILIHFWEPHWAIGHYDMKIFGAPLWEPECETDPSWGPNPDMTFDCNFPLNVGIFKVGNPSIDQVWPAAGRLLRQLSFDNADAGWMLIEVDQNGLSQAEAAAKWIEENRSTVDSWIETALADS